MRDKFIGFCALAASAFAGVAVQAAPLFPLPKTIGNDTGAATIITFTNNSSGGVTATVTFDTTQGPYDGSDDTIVGVKNNSSFIISNFALSSATTDIFGFESDGLNIYGFVNPTAAPTGYEGPNVTFTVNSVFSGIVNFTNSNGSGNPVGLAAGGSTFFALEENITTVGQLTLGASVVAVDPNAGSGPSGGGGGGAGVPLPAAALSFPFAALVAWGVKRRQARQSV